MKFKEYIFSPAITVSRYLSMKVGFVKIGIFQSAYKSLEIFKKSLFQFGKGSK